MIVQCFGDNFQICAIDEICVPSYNNPSEDAGLDLKSNENVIIPSGGQATIGTGLKIAMKKPIDSKQYYPACRSCPDMEYPFLTAEVRNPTPEECRLLERWALLIRGRSGLASKGIWCFHGTVDCGYHGEIKVILRNFGEKPFQISRGDKIAQAVMTSIRPMFFETVSTGFVNNPEEIREIFDSFPVMEKSERGARGFGSSDEKEQKQ
jgi:dUTPase